MTAAVGIERYWGSWNAVSLGLLPLSLVYCAAVLLRRGAYRVGLLRVRRLPVPVVVIGNLTVGGTGKTPLVAWTARFLARHGYRPGIVSRGYGGRAASRPREARADSDPDDVGDEPVLLARRGGCPVMVGPSRFESGRRLIEEHGCDVVVSDDGLQHLGLARDVSVSVVDGTTRFGNGLCLPAGPLREPVRAAGRVDLEMCYGEPRGDEMALEYAHGELVAVRDASLRRAVASLHGQPVHAVAGIGRPQRFFDALEKLGLDVLPHPFPDHHRFAAGDLGFAGDAPVVMTEKDAVKCARFAGQSWWYLPIEARPDPRYGERLLARLRSP